MQYIYSLKMFLNVILKYVVCATHVLKKVHI